VGFGEAQALPAVHPGPSPDSLADVGAPEAGAWEASLLVQTFAAAQAQRGSAGTVTLPRKRESSAGAMTQAQGGVSRPCQLRQAGGQVALGRGGGCTEAVGPGPPGGSDSAGRMGPAVHV